MVMRPKGACAVPAAELRSFYWYLHPTDNSYFDLTRSVRLVYTFNTKCLSAAHQSDFFFLSSRTEFAWGCAAGPRDKCFPTFSGAKQLKNYVFLLILYVFFLFLIVFGDLLAKSLQNYIFLCFATVGSESLLAYWAVFMVKYQGGEGSSLWLGLFLYIY